MSIMEMMERKINEIHQMLCKVCNYIDKIQSPEYIKYLEDRDFSINVAADLYVEQLEKLRHERK